MGKGWGGGVGTPGGGGGRAEMLLRVIKYGMGAVGEVGGGLDGMVLWCGS